MCILCLLLCCIVTWQGGPSGIEACVR